MVDDVRDLAGTSSQLFSELLKPILELSLFASQLASLVGGKATALLALYVISCWNGLALTWAFIRSD
jgi:ABC-type uncharacterized transport system fused permease/ATPase subunit